MEKHDLSSPIIQGLSPHPALTTKRCYLHGRGWFSRLGGDGLTVGLEDLKRSFPTLMILWFYREHHFSETAYIFFHLLHRKGDPCLSLYLSLNCWKIFVLSAEIFPKQRSGAETLQNGVWRLFRSSPSFFTNSIWYFILICLVWFRNVYNSDQIPPLKSSSKCKKQSLCPSTLHLHTHRETPCTHHLTTRSRSETGQSLHGARLHTDQQLPTDTE